jgi:hypothetical protein
MHEHHKTAPQPTSPAYWDVFSADISPNDQAIVARKETDQLRQSTQKNMPVYWDAFPCSPEVATAQGTQNSSRTETGTPHHQKSESGQGPSAVGLPPFWDVFAGNVPRKYRQSRDAKPKKR